MNSILKSQHTCIIWNCKGRFLKFLANHESDLSYRKSFPAERPSSNDPQASLLHSTIPCRIDVDTSTLLIGRRKNVEKLSSKNQLSTSKNQSVAIDYNNSRDSWSKHTEEMVSAKGEEWAQAAEANNIFIF